MKELNDVWKKLALDLMTRDERLKPLIIAIGDPAPRFEKDAFRALARGIVSQQLAPGAARAIIERFKTLEPPFPKPTSIAQWRISKLRKAGLSERKAMYVKELAKAWGTRTWRANWNALSDEQLIARLTEIKGIGEWTAHMFLIFSVGRTDILPVGDYGVRRGVQRLYEMKEIPHPKALPEIVAHWKGASSVASWYLWRALDKKLL